MDEIKEFNLLIGEPIQFDTNIQIKVPTVEEAIKEKNIGLYTIIFTLTTRELFQTLRNIDELENKYPSIWAIIRDDEADQHIGSFFDETKTVSAILMEAFSYWTGLELGGDGGFHKHTNGKIVHIESEWVIDYETFREFGDVIKVITAYEPPESLPPKITSDLRYNTWINLLNNRRKQQERNALSWTDKIMILSIAGSSFIPVDEIRKMSIYHFYRLFNGLNLKEAYETKLAYHLSPKYESDKNPLKHWKELINRNKNKL